MQKKNKAKKAHLIGIAGAGMSALAILLRESGMAVSGSDEKAYEPILGFLKKNKINFKTKHAAKNIPKDAELVVVGKHAGLSPEENTETREAIRRGIEMRSLPEMLARLSQKTENIVVSGSYGKSTLSALLAFSLRYAKKDPSYFIGALPIDLANSSHLGRGKEFVLEGDEYPSATWDPRSKFLHFSPKAVVLTAAKHDHANIFPTEASYIEPYKKLVAKIPKTGYLIYSLHGKNNILIAKNSNAHNISYSVDDKNADWYAQNIKYSKITSFDIYRGGKKIITVKTPLLGKHNVENIVGAAAYLLENKKMSPAVFAGAIDRFHGIKRRIELVNKGKIPVYEGFGSSYEKTRAIFDALKLHYPDKKIVAVFEPHAFSWRNRKFLHWYRDIFKDANEVIMLPAVGRGKKIEDQLDTKDIWSEAKKYFPIRTAKNEKEALKLLKKITTEDSVVALISSGPMYGLPQSVAQLF